MSGSASGDSIRSSDIPVAEGDVPNGDRNVPAPYCFASAEREGLRFGGSVRGFASAGA